MRSSLLVTATRSANGEARLQLDRARHHRTSLWSGVERVYPGPLRAVCGGGRRRGAVSAGDLLSNIGPKRTVQRTFQQRLVQR